MAEKVNEITLSLGFKPFKFHFPDVDEDITIYFNPADADIPKRCFEAYERLNEYIEGMEEFEIDEEGLPVINDYVGKMNALNDKVFEYVDYAFGNKVSKDVFKFCSPFTVVNGNYFALQFIEAVAPVMEKIINDEKRKASKNSDKYYKKYLGKK